MSLHKEINFEEEICAHLAAHGWLYAKDDCKAYDRIHALFPADVVAWVQATQPQAWEALTKNHGSKAEDTLLGRLRFELDKRGTLDVLRNGIELIGLKGTLKLAQFKPALGMNIDILSRYQANRLRVVRQVRYSLATESCLDLVLFLNGVPVATAELKTDFTQSVRDAIDQYRFDRDPHPKGQSAEPLLGFPNGALVHFAISNSEVHMTTRLAGKETVFLPFNQGDHGGAGNPLNPNGHRTAYLWEQIWERRSWLEILGRYLVTRRDAKKVIQSVVFPRFHQLDVTRKLVAAVLEQISAPALDSGAATSQGQRPVPPGRTEAGSNPSDSAGERPPGPPLPKLGANGGRYLVQHSAGSGKTNSIAWTAHFLSDLHDAYDRKVFDTVIVVSDRTVIDDMLAETIFEFQRTTGVVATITGESDSKSAQLTEALNGTKKIVVCTIQTFPHALEKVRELAATAGKRFAVIADEAHSSQAGQAAVNLRAVLSPAELKEIAEGGEVSAEDVLAAQMAARADEKGITFVAFTATPKNKTMELFGTRPDPTRKPADDNKPAPFHVYSMRQAIEEKFILDVLKNYTPYDLAFRLAKEGADADDKEVERGAAMKKLMGWVRLHPYNIAQKVEVVVEHYRANVAPLLEGKAKAMVVVASRLEAVRWKLAMEKYIAEKGYRIGTLVAFSGEVVDQESGPEPFSEGSKAMNPGLKGRDIREAFATGEYQVLLVANKFQTGFDQPLLCGMYVDKRLAGIQAVQTLSRLNRAYPGKETTYVVDFVNDPDQVLEAFRQYYETAELAATTDPNLVFDLKGKLDATGHYDEFEVDRVANALLDPKAQQSELYKAIEPVADRILKKFRAAQAAQKAAEQLGDDAKAKSAKEEQDALVLFKGDLATYVRLYTFLSQIFDYGSTGIEKRALFYRALLPLLEFGRERESIDLSKVKLSHYRLHGRGTAPMVLKAGEKTLLEPLREAGSGGVQEKEKARLAAIIERLNDLFEGVTDQDRISYFDTVRLKLMESEVLREQALDSTEAQFAISPDLDSAFMEAVMTSLDAHNAMSTQVLNSVQARARFKELMLAYGLHAQLRAKAG